MMEQLNIALIQMTSGPSIEENMAELSARVREAAGKGSQFILSPENSCHIRFPQAEKLKSSPAEDEHPFVAHFSALAAELGVCILIGSVSVKVADDRIANRSLLFDAKGDIAAIYDKIHLFDVDLPSGESHRESNIVRPGEKAVVARTPWGGVGLSICYDLRFAYLYRALAQAGAKILTVPAAFTVPTGQAHWKILLRARAIETGAFVLAPGQCGTHEGNRKTYGHSLVVGPWGEVLAEGGDTPGIITASLDLSAVDKARTAIPALKHDREFSF